MVVVVMIARNRVDRYKMNDRSNTKGAEDANRS